MHLSNPEEFEEMVYRLFKKLQPQQQTENKAYMQQLQQQPGLWM